ncbi:MAG: HTH domain-containing protein [Chitinophagaceae bacterium]
MEKIIELLKNKGSVTVKEISDELNLSRQFLHRELNKLLAQGIVIKLGRSPFVYYQINKSVLEEEKKYELEAVEIQFLQKHFIIITELGEKLEGIAAMTHWCKKQKLPVEKTVNEFIETRKKYLNYFGKNNLIDGTKKITETEGIEKNYIDQLYYLDFYAIERFGKTRLGTLMHFAKQGQNKILMAQIVHEIKEKIEQLIENEKVDAVCYVPPTIKREVQIMSYLETHLQLKLPTIKIRKVHNQIVVPQKALSKIYERVANAQMSFVNIEKQQFQKILIIDDAVGSGATINEIAQKIKHNKTANDIIGLAITGSYKGFEVITEL